MEEGANPALLNHCLYAVLKPQGFTYSRSIKRSEQSFVGLLAVL
jgi:hypothetical protein